MALAIVGCKPAATATLAGDAVMSAGEQQLRLGQAASNPFWALEDFTRLPTLWAQDDARFQPYAGGGAPTPVPRQLFADTLFARYGLLYAGGGPQSDVLVGDKDPQHFPASELPIGLVLTQAPKSGSSTGLALTCEICHSMVVGGKLAVGTSTPFADNGRLFRDLNRLSRQAKAPAGAGSGATPDKGMAAVADGVSITDGLFVQNPPRNSVVNAADHLGRLGLELRRPTTLAMDTLAAAKIVGAQSFKKFGIGASSLTALQQEFDQIAYLRTPAWTTFRAKIASVRSGNAKAKFYYDGGLSEKANFAAYTYMLTFTAKLEGTDLVSGMDAWEPSAKQYMETLDAPAYRSLPLPPIDTKLAAQGRAIYAWDGTDPSCSSCHAKDSPLDLAKRSAMPGTANMSCAACHGTYTPKNDGAGPAPGYVLSAYQLQTYPSVGTDPLRAAGLPGNFKVKNDAVLGARYGEPYGQVLANAQPGYTAPPLFGVWARAPYLHNGAVPSLSQLLTCASSRVNGYALTADPRDLSTYDAVNGGWRYVPFGADGAVPTSLPPQARVFDPRVVIFDGRPVKGLTNVGHEYGCRMPPIGVNHKAALIEFLKDLDTGA